MNLTLMQQCEALIYMSGDEGVDENTLAMLCLCSTQDIEEAILSLKDRYLEHHSAFTIIDTAQKYKMVTVSEVHELITHHLHLKASATLSNSALETLAIIAYRQPCTKAIIEQLRGVNVDMIVRKLLALDLIQEVGRESTPGRPILYEVTSHFLDVFHLSSLDSLPTLKPIESEEKDLYVKSETA
jgi:segregation and condensation protein B